MARGAVLSQTLAEFLFLLFSNLALRVKFTPLKQQAQVFN